MGPRKWLRRRLIRWHGTKSQKITPPSSKYDVPAALCLKLGVCTENLNPEIVVMKSAQDGK
jgi:hypothetical protein